MKNLDVEKFPISMKICSAHKTPQFLQMGKMRRNFERLLRSAELHSDCLSAWLNIGVDMLKNWLLLAFEDHGSNFRQVHTMRCSLSSASKLEESVANSAAAHGPSEFSVICSVSWSPDAISLKRQWAHRIRRLGIRGYSRASAVSFYFTSFLD